MTKLDALLQPASTPPSAGDPVSGKVESQLTVRMATVEDADTLNAMIADFAAFERLPNQSTVQTVRKELGSSDCVLLLNGPSNAIMHALNLPCSYGIRLPLSSSKL